MNPLEARRRAWHQTPETHIPDADAAAQLIDTLGLITHYPASPEIPNIFHAYLGDPDAKTDSGWDTPSGQVYTWRWHLGGRQAGFYSLVVRKRPTWVSWPLLPAILRLRAELRTPDELFDLGAISTNAYRITRALEESGGTLSTAELRKAADFPTGKEQRAAYLKAVEELDSRLMLAKLVTGNGDEMSHALVSARYREHVDAAEKLSPDQACNTFLLSYLPTAGFAAPTPLARHTGIDEHLLGASLERMKDEGTVKLETVPSYKTPCYLWTGQGIARGAQDAADARAWERAANDPEFNAEVKALAVEFSADDRDAFEA
jgi:hypothetical protein